MNLTAGIARLRRQLSDQVLGLFPSWASLCLQTSVVILTPLHYPHCTLFFEITILDNHTILIKLIYCFSLSYKKPTHSITYFICKFLHYIDMSFSFLFNVCDSSYIRYFIEITFASFLFFSYKFIILMFFQKIIILILKVHF